MRTLLATLAVLLAACAPAPVAVPPLPPTATAAPTTTIPAPPASVEPTPSPTAPPTLRPTAPPCPGTSAPVGDVALIALCPDGAELRLAATLGADDRAAIVAQIRDDLDAVQREFAWTLRTRPIVYVLADRAGYVAALEHVFGYGTATAEFVADNSVAFFEPTLRAIAVEWDAVRDRRPIAAVRHELTHVVTLEACAPRCDLVPAWLNEGQAHLAEATIPGADWRLMRVHYEATSMVATDTLLPLSSLWSQAQWNALADWMGYYKYQEAARTVELLRADMGDGAIAKLYARIRAGQDVPSAYAALARRSFDSFTTTLEGRIRDGVEPFPGIATVTPGAAGGASFLLYGFPGEAKGTLHIRSHLIDEIREVSVSPQGALFGDIDASYPPGAYTITAAIGSTVAAVTVIKRGGRAVRAAPLD